jgi:hypothetical protein
VDQVSGDVDVPCGGGKYERQAGSPLGPVLRSTLWASESVKVSRGTQLTLIGASIL